MHEAAAGRSVEPAAQDEPQPAAQQPERAPEAPDVAEQATSAPILDLPESHREPSTPRVPKEVAVDLLDSVLDALPAPRRPGEGRRRSRRVSTPALTPGKEE